MRSMEIETEEQLRSVLSVGRPLRGLRFQDLDLRPVERELLARNDVHGLVVLGGTVSDTLAAHLRHYGAIVFPADSTAPVDTYRARLYSYTDLYAGLPAHGYADTPDARAYAWTKDARANGDAYALLQRAIHDDSMRDALQDLTAGRQVVGVMGGHAVQRGTEDFDHAAHLAHTLAAAGLCIATGGGPGAMEAANLGAAQPDRRLLDEALGTLATCPDFHNTIDAWARAAWEVRDSWPARDGITRSIGIPTWFYGHEPPNLFADVIAKFFSNASREDLLLALCTAGIVVLPGAAGTVQEIFQAVTPRYYRTDDVPPPLILVGTDWWTRQTPVWPALQALARGRPMEQSLHVVDSTQDVVRILTG